MFGSAFTPSKTLIVDSNVKTNNFNMFGSTSQNQFSFKLVINDIHDVLNSHSKFGAIVSACRTSLQLYPNFCISKTANLLAMTSMLYVSHHVFNYVSSCIEKTILNKMS
jgi:hypothetical protein